MSDNHEHWCGNPKYNETMPDRCEQSFVDADGFPQCDAGVATALGISKQTLWEWRNKFPEFKAAYLRGKTRAESAYSRIYTVKNMSGEKFQTGWAQFMHERQFGKMADVERDAGETNEEQLESYEARVNAIKQEHQKPE